MANVMPSTRTLRYSHPVYVWHSLCSPAAPVTMFGVCLSCHDRQIYIFISSRQPTSCHLSWTMTVFLHLCLFIFALLFSPVTATRREDTRWTDTNADLTPVYQGWSRTFEEETFEEDLYWSHIGEIYNDNQLVATFLSCLWISRNFVWQVGLSICCLSP